MDSRVKHGNDTFFSGLREKRLFFVRVATSYELAQKI